MTIGSFTVNGKRIEVETSYDNISGLVYQFFVGAGKSRKQVAVTTYRGIDVADDRFTKADLQRGLNVIRRQATRT